MRQRIDGHVHAVRALNLARSQVKRCFERGRRKSGGILLAQHPAHVHPVLASTRLLVSRSNPERPLAAGNLVSRSRSRLHEHVPGVGIDVAQLDGSVIGRGKRFGRIRRTRAVHRLFLLVVHQRHPFFRKPSRRAGERDGSRGVVYALRRYVAFAPLPLVHVESGRRKRPVRVRRAVEANAGETSRPRNRQLPSRKRAQIGRGGVLLVRPRYIVVGRSPKLIRAFSGSMLTSHVPSGEDVAVAHRNVLDGRRIDPHLFLLRVRRDNHRFRQAHLLGSRPVFERSAVCVERHEGISSPFDQVAFSGNAHQLGATRVIVVVEEAVQSRHLAGRTRGHACKHRPSSMISGVVYSDGPFQPRA